MTWVRFWRAAFVVLTVAELLALRSKRPDAPLCHACRLTCRIDTRPGRLGFILGWIVFSIWFLPHLVRETSETSGLTLET